jgi:hypothetical protein
VRPRQLWVGPALFLVLALGGGYACAQGSSPNYGRDFGTISLAAGQAQQVWIGPNYRLLRVCNDYGSAGTVAAVIDEQPSRTLPPGRCVEDYGNRIQFTNTGGGAAKLTYRPVIEPFTS